MAYAGESTPKDGGCVRRLAIFVVRRRWWVIGFAAVAVPIMAVYGANVHDELAAGGFFDPHAESTVAHETIVREFPLSSQSDFAIVVTAKSGNVDDPAVQAAGKDLTDRLSHDEGVVNASSYWSLGNLPQLKSKDQKQALIFATLEGNENKKLHLSGDLSPRYDVDTAAVSTDVTGEAEVTRQISDQAEKDLQRSDLLTAPLTFIALVVVFGSLVAAGLPLSVGILAVLGTFVVLKLLAQLTDVSVFSLNLTTGMGLGLAIDYSLFVVSRYREELGNGVSSPVAVGRVDADRGSHGRIQCSHGCDLTGRAGRVSDAVPTIVRVRWCRGRRARRDLRDRRVTGRARRARATYRERPVVQGEGDDRRRVLAPSGRSA